MQALTSSAPPSPEPEAHGASAEAPDAEPTAPSGERGGAQDGACEGEDAAEGDEGAVAAVMESVVRELELGEGAAPEEPIAGIAGDEQQPPGSSQAGEEGGCAVAAPQPEAEPSAASGSVGSGVTADLDDDDDEAAAGSKDGGAGEEDGALSLEASPQGAAAAQGASPPSMPSPGGTGGRRSTEGSEEGWEVMPDMGPARRAQGAALLAGGARLQRWDAAGDAFRNGEGRGVRGLGHSVWGAVGLSRAGCAAMATFNGERSRASRARTWAPLPPHPPLPRPQS